MQGGRAGDGGEEKEAWQRKELTTDVQNTEEGDKGKGWA